MPIQIDSELFLPKIHKKCDSRMMGNESKRLSSAVLEIAQGWFDDPPFKRNKEIDTQVECRIDLKYYILEKIKLKDRKSKFFIPTFVWVFIAQQVISYIVKLLIEHYWTHRGADGTLNLHEQILSEIHDVDIE
tara:strand:+ start:850 stop:1248 length:399 start_codon:yes stop_codon:yes gene_type:complete